MAWKKEKKTSKQSRFCLQMITVFYGQNMFSSILCKRNQYQSKLSNNYHFYFRICPKSTNSFAFHGSKMLISSLWTHYSIYFSAIVFFPNFTNGALRTILYAYYCKSKSKKNNRFTLNEIRIQQSATSLQQVLKINMNKL